MEPVGSHWWSRDRGQMDGGSRVPHGVGQEVHMGSRITEVLQGQELGRGNRSAWFEVMVVGWPHGGQQVGGSIRLPWVG